MENRTRLFVVAPDMVLLAEKMSSSKRISVARKVSEWACSKTGVDAWIGISEVKRMLDDEYQLTVHEKEKLEEKIEFLDDQYFSIVEENDGLDEAGEALKWFCKARAGAALILAMDSAQAFEFCETLYEAQAATNDLKTIRKFVAECT